MCVCRSGRVESGPIRQQSGQHVVVHCGAVDGDGAKAATGVRTTDHDSMPETTDLYAGDDDRAQLAVGHVGVELDAALAAVGVRIPAEPELTDLHPRGVVDADSCRVDSGDRGASGAVRGDPHRSRRVPCVGGVEKEGPGKAPAALEQHARTGREDLPVHPAQGPPCCGRRAAVSLIVARCADVEHRPGAGARRDGEPRDDRGACSRGSDGRGCNGGDHGTHSKLAGTSHAHHVD